MPSWSPCRSSLVVCATVLLLQSVDAAAQAPDLLFSPAPRGARVQRARPVDGLVRERVAQVSSRWLDQAGETPKGGAMPFRLNLFDDTVLTLRGEATEVDDAHRRSWSGAVSDDPTSTVVMTWLGDDVLGRVQAHGRSFAIDPAGAPGLVRIREIAATPVADDALVVAPLDAASTPLAAVSASTPVVDVLVLYTTAAAARAGGTSGIELSIANSIAVTNTAFQRSGVDAIVRLAAARPLFYVESLGGLGIDLYEIGATGSMGAIVEQARQETGADLVALITGRSSLDSGCGTAWLGPSPAAIHSVTEEACLFAGQWSFSHELGHNFGADHAPGDPIVSPVPYARGYRDGRVRTLMAYPVPGAPLRVLNFSSASVREPAGTGTRTGLADQDNARRLNETAATVAALAAALAPPDAPTGFAATVVGHAVTLSWTPPATGGAVAAYTLEAGTVPGAADVGQFLLPASPFTFPDVGPGRYYARLRSRGPGGDSAATTDLVVDVGPLCAPPAPATIAATVGGGIVTLQWAAAPGTAATTFLVGLGTAPGVYDLGVVDVGTLTSTAVPAPPGRYVVQAAGRNACGMGAPSPALVVLVP